MDNNIKSINELYYNLIKNIQFDYILYLKFGDIIVEISMNSKTLIQKLSQYFKDFITHSTYKPNISVKAIDQDIQKMEFDFVVKQPDPGKTKIKEEFVDFPDGRIVYKRLTGMHFLFGQGINLAIGPCVDNDNQVINFVNNRYIETQLNNNYILGHAAAVQIEGMGISVAGFSGAGKSTFALHMMSQSNAKFVSNDRLLVKKVDSGLIMSGVAKLPRINPGTIINNPDLIKILSEEEKQKFRQLPKEELWELEHKYDAYIDKIYGANRFSLFSKMDALFILNWNRSEEPFSIQQVDLNQRRDLLVAFMKSPGLFYEPDEIDIEINLSEDAYIEHLQECKTYEITGGAKFEKAVDKVVREIIPNELK